MKKAGPLVLVLFLVLLGSTASLQAAVNSPTGTLTGRVTDRNSNEPLAGANILLLGTNIGAATNLDGNYSIATIPPGVYAIQFSSVGYGQVVRTDISISPARPTELDVELEPTSVALEEVTFRAGFFEKDPDAKLSTVVQSSEEIRRLPGGFEDVARAISILPGVGQPSPGRNDLVVRGGAPSENLYLVDNIDVPNINHFGTQGASGGPQSFINLDYIDRTSFSTGGFGARYGDRLSSVLTIDLREGRKDKIGGKATISASQFGLNIEGPLVGEDGSFLFSARRSYLDFIFEAAGFAFVPEYWDFLAKANTSINATNQISVLGIAALDNVKLFNDSQDQRYDNARIPATDQNTYIGGVTWKHLFGNGFTNVTLGQTVTEFNTIQLDSLLNPVFSNSSREAETSLRAEVVARISENTEFTAGVQQKFVGFNADLLLPPFTTSYGEVITVDESYDTLSTKSAAYGQVSQEFGDLLITAGGRLDAFTMIDNPYAFSPRLSATYPLSMLTNVNASVGRYHQAPSYIWLVSNPLNRKLDHLQADQVVLGFDHLIRFDVRVSIEGYYKQYANYPTSTSRPYLVLANTGAGYGGAENNFSAYGLEPLVSEGTGWARGLELFLQKKASELPHYATASLSWNEARFTGLDGVERPSSYDQRWIFNIGGGFLFSRTWEMSFRFRLATGRPYTPFESDGSQDPAKYNTERTKINHSLDLRTDRRWFFDNYTLIGYIDIQNVYNNGYVGAPRWDGRKGRTIEDSSIGLLPSIGLSLEF
ncbi:TonB-dependent receptor [bacterium]|nr:TonB-dependent receptor [bacterium]